MSNVVIASQELAGLIPKTDEMRQLHREYLEFAQDERRTYRETATAQHLTVSAFVFSPDLARVVLCFHKKGQFWVQLGGHIESGDQSLRDAARREATEESGLVGLRLLGQGAADLDRHELNSGFGSCAVHWDVGYAFVADDAEHLNTSDESEDVEWWPVDALPQGIVDNLDRRIARIVASLTCIPHSDR